MNSEEIDNYRELSKVIKELRQNLKHKKERRIYNIYAGVCKKSILAQNEEINKIKSQIEALEYVYQSL